MLLPNEIAFVDEGREPDDADSRYTPREHSRSHAMTNNAPSVEAASSHTR